MPDQYDAIIIGTGAGGGTLAYHLAQAGKRILVLDEALFFPRKNSTGIPPPSSLITDTTPKMFGSIRTSNPFTLSKPTS